MSSNLIADLTQINLIKTNIKNAIINKGQTVTNFNSYSGAIENISVGGGDILVYNNISEMQSNTVNESDLALVYSIDNLQALWQYTNNNWELAPTGLTANREYVNLAKFWGVNGVETGVLQVNNNLTNEQVKIKAQVFNDLSYLELDSSINNLHQAFYSRQDLQVIPNINTSSIKDMTMTFGLCQNLKSIPNFDTSNVTTMFMTFYMCSKITNIPNFNTSKVTSMHRLLTGCKNLTTIPNFDMSNVTDISEIFSDCHNLITVPNFNTSKVTSMHDMFYNCYNLTTVPVLNMSNVTNIRNIFYYCTNLSDASIANITNMLPNANQLTNQYVTNIGLNLNRFDNNQLRILNNKGYIDAII